MDMDCAKLIASMTLETNENKEKSSVPVSQPTFYKSECVKIDGVKTEIVYAEHKDKILIIATQLQKLGSLLTVTREQVENLDTVAEVVYTVTPVFGVENPEQQAAARFIAEQLDPDRKLCFFLCLKKYDPETVKALVDVLLLIKNK